MYYSIDSEEFKKDENEDKIEDFRYNLKKKLKYYKDKMDDSKENRDGKIVEKLVKKKIEKVEKKRKKYFADENFDE